MSVTKCYTGCDFLLRQVPHFDQMRNRCERKIDGQECVKSNVTEMKPQIGWLRKDTQVFLSRSWEWVRMAQELEKLLIR